MGDNRPHTDTEIARAFGDYELLAEIGRGGMGLVYRARQTSLNRLVALKMVRDSQLTSPETAQRFSIEAEAAAKLHHPNIVPIYDFGQLGEQRYFSMKLIVGENLVQHLHGVPMDGPKLARLMATLAHAIHHAHQRGVIHRDLKPANVLLNAEGQPFITDFGCARFTDASSVLTLPNDVLGSPNYMAPEQAVGGSEQVTTSADVYSLGAIMYELLTGRPPFRAPTPLETLRKVMEEDPEPPRQIYRFANKELETICLKCMEKHPRQRYDSAAALADDLERWLGRRPIQARRASTFERVQKWAQRNPSVAALVVLLHIVGLVGLAGILWLGARATASARESHEREVRMQVANGNRLVEQGDQFEGLLWLSEALRSERGDGAREESHRRRIDAVLRTSPRLEQILFHSDWLIATAFSPDGTRLVTGGSDGTARVWDTRTGQSLLTLQSPAGQVECAQFSPDGKRLLTMDSGGAARVWNATTGAAITPPLKPDDFDGSAIETGAKKLRVCAAFSPEGDRVITAWGSPAAHIWDATSGKHLFRLPNGRLVHHAAFSPDGRYIVTSSSDKTARVWDAGTGKPLTQPLAHDRFVAWAQFSPDGRTLLTVGDRMTVHLWDWASARELVPPLEHGEVLFHASFSPDGKHVLTASWDRTARIWNTATGLSIARFLHPAGLGWAAWSPDGRSIATGCFDGIARVWAVDRTDQAAHAMPAGAAVSTTSFSPDGRYLAVATWDGTLHLWKCEAEGPLVRTVTQSDVIRAEFNSNASQVVAASGGKGRAARVWAVATGEAMGPPLTHAAPIRHASFSRDSKRVLTASEDGTARLWEIATGRETIQQLQHPAAVREAVFAADERSFITGCDDGLARVWGTDTGKLIWELPHKLGVTSLAASPVGSAVASGSRDGTARVWDLATGKPITPPLTNLSAVAQVRFSPDGRRLVTACESPGRAGGQAQVWDARTGQTVGAAMRHSDDVASAEFSPDGHAVVTASADRSARIWDALTGKPTTPPLWHGDNLAHAVFTPDARRVATLTTAGEVRLWDASTGEPITPPTVHAHRYDTGQLMFSADGEQLLVATGGDAFFIHQFPRSNASLDDLLLQAHVLSGHHIDPAAGMLPLGRNGLSNAWQQLRSKTPAPTGR